MNIKILFLIVIVCSLTFAQQEEETLKRIAKDSFGKQVLQTIQLQLSQQNAASQIYTMLNKLFYDLREEDSSAAKSNGERQAYCGDQLLRIKTAQDNAVVAKADYERQVPGRQEELRDKKNQYQQKNEEIKRNDQLLINLSKERQEEHNEYERKRDEMIAMINGLKQAQQIIRQMQSSHPGGALVQLNEHHQNMMQFAGNNEFRKITSLLMELCADSKIHSDSDNVQVILDIIDDLVESIYEVQKKEMYAEDWAQKFFEEDLQRIQKESIRLLGSMADDQAKMEFSQARLEELNQQISTQQMLFDNKEMERKDFDVSCREDATAAEQFRVARQDQIKVILELLELFENHFNDRIRAVLLEMFQ